MMRFISLLRRDAKQPEREVQTERVLQARYESTIWKDSKAIAGARYCVRRASLRQRIELVQKARELTLRNEFLNAGNSSDQQEATLADLRAQQLYLEWGLVEVSGMTIDGQKPSVGLLIERGPEALTNEIVEAIQMELNLTEDERKNS